MDYIVIGSTAHISGFNGDFDELINYMPASLITTLEFLGVAKVVWGQEGENWEQLSSFPKMSD